MPVFSQSPIFSPLAAEQQGLEIEKLRGEVEDAPRLIDIKKQELLQTKIKRYAELSDRDLPLAAKLWNADPDLVRIGGTIDVVDRPGYEEITVRGQTLIRDKRTGVTTQVKMPTRQQREGEEFSLLTPEERRMGVLAPIEQNIAGAEASRGAAERDRARAALDRARVAGTLPAAPGSAKAPQVHDIRGVPYGITDNGVTYDINDPNLPAHLKTIGNAAQHAAKEAENRLTSSTRTMVEAAPTVEGLANLALADIDIVGPRMGPLKGRWTEFVVGGLGFDDPDWTKFRSRVHLSTTLLMRMHVGARGGEYIQKGFKDILAYGKQSPNNMRASLEVLREYSQMVQKKPMLGKEAADALYGLRKKAKIPTGPDPAQSDTESVGIDANVDAVDELLGRQPAQSQKPQQPGIIDIPD